MQAAPVQTDAQVWSSERYDTHARFVSDLGSEIAGWLAPQPGERILDLGCGDGELTLRLKDAGAQVVGVDSSEEFVRTAREKGLDARLADGHELGFSGEFDAVFSNAALHWMTRPEAVVAGVARALKPRGRFVAEFGGHGNVAAIATALRAVAVRRSGRADLIGPWYFPSAEEYAGLLEGNGFTVKRSALVPRPTRLPTDIRGWFTTFCDTFFAQFGDQVDEVVEEVVSLLEPALCDASGHWTADYVRLRVEAALDA